MWAVKFSAVFPRFVEVLVAELWQALSAGQHSSLTGQQVECVSHLQAGV